MEQKIPDKCVGRSCPLPSRSWIGNTLICDWIFRGSPEKMKVNPPVPNYLEILTISATQRRLRDGRAGGN